MKYNLSEIFDEATNDTYAITLDGSGYESRLVYGVKIIRDLTLAFGTPGIITYRC